MAYDKLKTESYEQIGGINAKASPYVNDPMEFRDLTNVNFFTPGALTKRPGTSLYLGATISGRVTGGIEFEMLNGSSFIVATANTNAYSVTNSWSAFKTGLLNNALFDFVVFVDRLFAGNGQDFYKYDGSNSTSFSLPPGQETWGVTRAIGGGLSGTFVASYGYLNDRGYIGPAANGKTLILNGITFGTINYYGLNNPSGYGVTSQAFYRTTADGVDLTGTTFQPGAGTTFSDTGFPLTSRIANFNLWFTLAPRYFEIYNNQLFMGGFSAYPSTVFWSEIGEPEGIDPEFNAEFRTNDGDRVTGLKSYNGSLVVTKERSFHRVTGDNPSNFLLQEVSDQYGCISNRAMVTFESLFWFLDTKGICEYDGANVSIISNKVEPIFASMNIPAARDNAVAIHYRQYNEVWFGIPINGATFNNAIVVFDYLTKAWTKYEGLQLSSLFLAKGTQDIKTPFFGGYSGTLSYFGSSLMNDNGNAITCMIDTHFVAPAGQTVEQQYRRFYLNVEPVIGVTQAIDVRFRTNYGFTVQISRTMYQNPYQSRVDFGLSARSIQAEIVQSSSVLSFKVFGYAFAHRFQRDS